MLDKLREDLPIVGDVRGAGYFHALELVKDKETKESFNDEESEELLRGFLSGELYKRGLICRADDRGDPVIQLSPPLIADSEEFEEIERVLRQVLTEAWERIVSPELDPDAHRPRARVDEMGLELAAGEDGADAPVRWVHISRAARPDALAVGRRAAADHRHPARHRRARSASSCGCLVGHHLAGLGFGTGFDHDAAARRRSSRRPSELGFPVFEVPYELPFIAITEKAFTRLVNEQYEVLQRGIAIHKRLERLVLEERGLDEVVRALAAAIGGAVCVLSGRGETIASEAFRRAAARRGAGAGARGGARGASAPHGARGPSTTPSSRPTTRTSPAARSCCPCRCAAAARRRPGSWPRATPAGSATSSG